LRVLKFYGEFNQPLSNSLDRLSRLEKPSFCHFDQPFGNSLARLSNLKQLKLDRYDQPLEDSLSGLINLEHLEFYVFDQPLGDSLSGLSKLVELDLGESYTKPINGSLEGLAKLKVLRLGELFRGSLTYNTYNHTSFSAIRSVLPSSLCTLNMEYNYDFTQEIPEHDNLVEVILGDYRHTRAKPGAPWKSEVLSANLGFVMYG
jgi:hypothetical protein